MVEEGIMKKRIETYTDGVLVSVDERDYTRKELKEMAQSALSDNDQSVVRVIEDLIDLLVQKNLVSKNEFDKKVTDKLDERKALRQQISDNA